MDRSDALEAAIREKAEKLNEFYPRIMSCRVVVEEVAAHKRQGKLFDLRIDVKVPGHEIAITRDRNEDIFVALRDAFDAAKRKLEDEVRVQRGDVKVHEIPQHGRIARLEHESGFGFIEAPMEPSSISAEKMSSPPASICLARASKCGSSSSMRAKGRRQSESVPAGTDIAQRFGPLFFRC